MKNHIDTAKYLLATKEVDVNAVDAHGWTAFTWAALSWKEARTRMQENTEAKKRMLPGLSLEKVDANDADAHKLAALICPRQRSEGDSKRTKEDAKAMIQMLPDHGADPSIGKVVDIDPYVNPPHNIFKARYCQFDAIGRPCLKAKKGQLTLTRK